MEISFVIPAYNEEKLLPACLESIRRELERAPCEAEVVVVNNASTDRTREVASHCSGVRVIDEQKKGIVRARRAGFIQTSGELVANIDADTELPAGWLSTALREFEKNPNLVALSGPFIYRDLSSPVRGLIKVSYFLGWLGYLFNKHVLSVNMMLQGGNFVIRRGAWERAGGFDTTIEFYGEDVDVARRIGRQGEVKWTWKLPMYTSGRRFVKEGLVRTGYTYAMNVLSISVWGRPASREYSDVRL